MSKRQETGQTTQKEYINSLLCSRSVTHLFMCAIHSDFSVAVAAYTAKDLVGVLMSQPLRNSE